MLTAVCFLFLLTITTVGSIIFQSAGTSETIGGGSIANQVAFGSIFLVLLFGSCVRNVRTIACIPVGIMVVLGYCYLSTLWAIDFVASFRRITLVAIMTWIIFRLIDDLGPDRSLRLLRWFLLGLLAANFLAVFLLPDGIHRDLITEEESVIGSWRGIVSHKNAAGAITALTIVLFLFDNRQFSRGVTIAVVAAAAVFLWFTHSKTSQGVVVLAILAGWAIRHHDADRRVVLAGMLMVVATLALLLVSANIAFIDDVVNDPNALTGRAQIWPPLIEYVGAHPWTGAGFQSFWAIGDASPIFSLTSSWVSTNIQHGHNGYLDLLVTIGVPGTLLAVATLIVWPLLRLLFSLSIAKPRRSLLLAIILFCAGQNMAETTILAASYGHVFLMIALAIVYRQSQGSAGQHHQLRRRALRLLGLRRAARPAR
ncbi:O-antigen ligase family protein [Sphingomonas sp. Leaf25]|uniref:O-antigen ligase family protein n=1 Tax=Sphingomonas sp. Leaf25 TaxID=1735692 RepID=UPI0007009AF2|nr:O-antigen ligase family protein [Sphingomonas sp. Leaf25]KQM96461.1 hypothetical protein ASE78_10590 [Sphingomonas sp. Leaf25]